MGFLLLRSVGSGAIQVVSGSPSTAAAALPRTSVTDDGPSARSAPGSSSSPPSSAPGTGRNTTVGVTATGRGTQSDRVNRPGVSESRPRAAAQRTRPAAPSWNSVTHAERPVSSGPRTQPWTFPVVSGSSTCCRIAIGASVYASDRATPARANWLPAVPSPVSIARICTWRVGPDGARIRTGSPGFTPCATALPASVVTRREVTSGPIALAVVTVTARFDTGSVKSICNHRPTAESRPRLTQAVRGSASNAAAVDVAGAVCPGWVASAAEPLEVTRTRPGCPSSSHCATTGACPATG